MLIATKRTLLSARKRIIYLLGPFRFNTDQAAPIASPRTESGAVGALALDQTNGQYSTSGGYLRYPVTGAGTVFSAPTAFARTIGRAVFYRVNRDSATLNWPGVGWSNAYPAAAPNDTAIICSGSSLIAHMSSSGPSLDDVGIAPAGTDWDFGVILRSAGAFMLSKQGSSLQWKLHWVANTPSNGTVYATSFQRDSAGGLTRFRVTDLPAPWTDDYGIATQRLAGARSAGDTFSHEANCHVEFTVTTLPGAGGLARFAIRQQDTTNYWQIDINESGTFSLYERIANVATLRGSAASVVANGHRVVIIADGTTIRGFSNNVLRWTYSSASSFQAEVTGKLVNLTGTGGAISDIISWPRTLSGAALSALSGV